jgi:putative DNA primase/helicase
MIPFDQINAAAVSALPSLLPEWFPRGKFVGKEFLIGDLSGSAGESLSINVRSGKWGDFAGGDRGGDPISLAAALFHNGDRVAAAKDLGQRLGVYTNGTTTSVAPPPKVDKPKDDWRDFFPPEDAPAPDLSGWDHAYVYRSGDGFIRRYVVRKDARGSERKKIMPLTYGILNGKEGWHYRHPLAPRSLYGIDRLYEMPSAAVIVCEGEKAADAAQLLFPRSPCITWTAGAGNVGKTDWSPLEGRRVIIWPDNDEPGIKAALEITEILSGIASKVGTIRVDDLPEKADAADVTIDNPVEWIKARLSWEEVESASGAERPPRRQIALETIKIKAGEIDVTATEGEAALISADMPVYQRGESLVRPGKREVSASGGRVILAPGLSEISATGMVDLLCQAVAWEKYDARSKDWIECNPPASIAQTILSRVGQWEFKSIAGVITTPTLRPDGSILSRPGYDAATRLFYLQDPSLRLDAERLPVSKGHAEDALDDLESLLSGFPLVSPLDVSVALSAMITPVVRGIMSVSPLHAFRASTAGTGKSYLADVASAIQAGRPCPVVAAGQTEEETEKRLVGLLLGGYPLLSLDNVNGELGGDLLCQAAERPIIRVRELGGSSITEIENSATIFANGNNLRVRGDMTRRTLLANLDAKMERPELREFEFDPFRQVLEDRGRYVAAALTIVRSYLVSGDKMSLPPIASFEDWSRTVRAALVWLGKEDPCKSMEEARDDDPVLADLHEVLVHAVPVVQVNRQFIVREIAEASGEWVKDEYGNPIRLAHPDLREALMRVAAGKNEINTRVLGKWLSANEGRVVGGLRFSRAKESMFGVQWRIERV